MKNILLLFTVLISFSSFSQKGQPQGGTSDFGWSTIKGDSAEYVFYLGGQDLILGQDIRFTNKADAVEFVIDYKESAREIKTIVKPLYTIVSTKVNIKTPDYNSPKVSIKILDQNGDLLEDVGWQYSDSPHTQDEDPYFSFTEEEYRKNNERLHYLLSKNPSKSLKKFVARRISFWNEITKYITN